MTEQKKNKSALPKLTGTTIPVAALKTTESCGVGEFLDLIPFIDFCKKCNLKLIQLLPVNDTGTESSPYSALSAFALHPIYIRLQSIPEAKSFKQQISELAKKHANNERFDYTELRQDKCDLLIKIFAENKEKILNDVSLKNWIKINPWIKNYAVFMKFKREYKDASWKSWTTFTHPTKEEIEAEWCNESNKHIMYYFAWVQMNLDIQFKEATSYANKNGILIKGDIPIMMNEDSCDSWANPDFFNDSLRAGSPPDNYNPYGQNWGFPIYNWQNLEADNYSWWKERLKSAAKYYDAYRIDHVLGFFRIWAIPTGERTAVLGYPQPCTPITLKELHEAGFSDDRIRWLSRPHVPTNAIESVNNNDYLGTHGYLHQLMDRIGEEEMWLFKPEIQTENDIYSYKISEQVKNKLAEFWRNRTLIEISKNKFMPIWTYRDTIAWNSLSFDEKNSLQMLIDEKNTKMEKQWEKQAKKLLSELTGSVDMIPCAEDLGANPESVPKVMKALNILSLQIVRWSRKWNENGQPYCKPEDYPLVSVAANSVHDSSTIRGWWLNEHAGYDFIRDFGNEENISPENYTPETAKYVLSKIAKAASTFCIHPIQDFLHLSQSYYDENPDNERVNIPGSVTKFNWTYRLPKNIETLLKDKELIDSIKYIASLHCDN